MNLSNTKVINSGNPGSGYPTPTKVVRSVPLPRGVGVKVTQPFAGYAPRPSPTRRTV